MSNIGPTWRKKSTWVAKQAQVERERNEAEIEKLRALLEEAAVDLALYVDHEHQLRDSYPDEMRRYKRDMDLVNRIRKAIRGEDSHD